MGRILILAAVLGGLFLLLMERPARDPLADAQRWEAYAAQRQFEAEYKPILDAIALAWRALPLAMVIGAALVALDAYVQRRRPLVRLDPDGVQVRRDDIGDDAMIALQTDLARLRQAVYAVTSHPAPPARFEYAPHVVLSSRERETRAPEPDSDAFPTAPTLAQIVAGGFTPTVERMLLGFRRDGALYGSISDLLSTAIAGRPGQGKSNLLRVITWQAYAAGGAVFLLDPHGGIVDDAAEMCSLGMASSAAELNDAARMLAAELDTRLARRRQSRERAPYLVLCDELPVLRRASKAAVDTVGRIVLEGRKVDMYALISGQGMPAEAFDGRLVRDALSSRFIFKTTPDEARRCGLSGTAAKMVANLRPGLAILDGPVPPDVVAIPLATAGDMAALLSKRQWADVASTALGCAGSQTDAKRVDATPDAKMDAKMDAKAAISADAQRAAELYLNGASIPDIVAQMFGIKSSDGGRRYAEARDRVEALIRDAFKAERG